MGMLEDDGSFLEDDGSFLEDEYGGGDDFGMAAPPHQRPQPPPATAAMQPQQSMSTRSLRNLAFVLPASTAAKGASELFGGGVRPSLRQSCCKRRSRHCPRRWAAFAARLSRGLHHRQSHTRAHSSLRHSPRRSRHQTRTAASSVRLSPRRNRRLNRRLNRRQPCRLSLPPSPLHH